MLAICLFYIYLKQYKDPLHLSGKSAVYWGFLFLFKRRKCFPRILATNWKPNPVSFKFLSVSAVDLLYLYRKRQYLEVKIPSLFFVLSQSWNASTDFSRRRHYRFSRKYIWWESTCSCDKQTDGHDEANSRFSQLCESGFKTRGNVRMRRFRETTVAVENKYCLFLCVPVGARAWECDFVRVAWLI
jgi:hypothetical protein